MSTNPFELAQELHGHTADVRCACVVDAGGLVTGSRDRSIRLWRRPTAAANQQQDDDFEQSAVNAEDHPHWVNALLAVPSTTDGGPFVVSGCHDGKIRVFDSQLRLLSTLSGHTGPVSSLTLLEGGGAAGVQRLASGSWDGSARIWDLSSLSCVAVLDNQENSVCVLSLPGDQLVCGSAGRAQGNAIVDSTIRVYSLSSSTPSPTLLHQSKPHSGPIRCLAKLEGAGAGWCSTSNDGSVILYNNNSPVQRMVNPPGFEGSPAFVYCAAQVGAGGLLATACDDCVVRVWDVNGQYEIQQEIEHPSTVWWVCALGNGDDLATMGGDGTVRVFSRTRPPCSNAADFKLQARTAREAQRNKSSGGGGQMDVSKLVRIEDAASEGIKDQHVQVFNKHGQAVAYQFLDGAWVEIGHVVSGGEGEGDGDGREEFNGQRYDKVVPVEIADETGEAGGGMRHLKIAFNYQDNPYLVANQFIKDHQLPDFYLDQIVDFIRNHTPANAVSSTAAAAAPPVQRCFPLAVALVFEKGNAGKAVQKLKELFPLAAQQSAALDGILDVLNATSRYHATEFTPQQIQLVCVGLLSSSSTLNDRFPVYDLLRAMLLHPDCANQLAVNKLTERVFADALVAASSPSASSALVLCALRMACNLCRYSKTLPAVLQACGQIDWLLDAVSSTVANGGGDGNVRVALASLLANVSSAVASKPSRGDRDLAILAQCSRGALRLLQQGDGDEAGLRCLQTVGAVALVEPALVDRAQLSQLSSSQLKRAEWAAQVFPLLQ